MKKAMFALAAVAVLGTTAGAAAQSVGVSLEARVDAAIPSGDFGEDVGTAPAFTVSGTLGMFPNVGIYGSYSRAQFQVKGTDADFTDEGFSVGLTVGLPPLPGTRLSPWIGAGALFHHISFDTGGDLDSDVGFEVGAGVAVPVAPRVRLTPAVGYRGYTTETSGAGGGEFDITYITAGVGVNISF